MMLLTSSPRRTTPTAALSERACDSQRQIVEIGEDRLSITHKLSTNDKPYSISVRRDTSRHMTALPGGRSFARAR
jgi:hypothetical protein